MQGEELLPLNMMDRAGEIYLGHAKKYEGREELRKAIIPKLNCKWNDVIQFSATHPNIIAKELCNFIEDFQPSRRKIYRMPYSTAINKYRALVFQSRFPKEKGDYTVYKDEVFYLDDTFLEPTEVPQGTLEFWEKAKRGEVPFLWFPFVPHVFIHGKVELSDLEEIDLEF